MEGKLLSTIPLKINNSITEIYEIDLNGYLYYLTDKGCLVQAMKFAMGGSRPVECSEIKK